VVEPDELTTTVVGAGASLHGDHARLHRDDEFEQLGARHGRAQQLGLAGPVAALHCVNALGEIDADGQNRKRLPLPKVSMRVASPSLHVGGLRPNAA
jgi:hypothetical protein